MACFKNVLLLTVVCLIASFTQAMACPPTTAPSVRMIDTSASAVNIWLWPKSRTPAAKGKRLEDRGWVWTEWQFADKPADLVDYDYFCYRTDSAFAKTIDNKTKNLGGHFIFGVGKSHTDKFTLRQPVGQRINDANFEFGQSYHWRVRALSNLSPSGGGTPTVFWASPWSKIHDFTTSFFNGVTCVSMPPLVQLDPLDGATNVPLDLTFHLYSWDVPPQNPCLWDMTEIEIRQVVNGQELTFGHHVSRKNNGHSHKAKLFKNLAPATAFTWRARALTQSASGPWTDPAGFVTGGQAPPTPLPLEPPPITLACLVLETPITISPLHGSRIGLNETIVLSLARQGELLNCRWDETAWQILDTETGEYVFQSGFTRKAVGQYRLESSIFQPGKSYEWRAKVVSRGNGSSGEDIFSDWSNTAEFSIN